MNRSLRLLTLLTLLTPIAGLALPGLALAQSKDDKARFYDFSDQLIDGEIKKPTALYMESRSRARFDKLLKLKKSFKPAMIETAKERVLK
ncbi:MAG: hypothetical protein EXR79_02935 [Myxococcales bacterium]|nr:hypothetical protein [Myxococcales bacterium]